MPLWNDVVANGLSLVGALGGVGVVAAAVAKFVSDHAAQRWLQDNQGRLDHALEVHRAELAKETETHKLKLRRQELMFQRELDAADAFMKLSKAVSPQYRFPDMDWYDACSDLAGCLDEVERACSEYLERHSVAISPAVRQLISTASGEAASEKFFVNDSSTPPPKQAVEAAGRILDAMQEARDVILADLRR